LLPEKCLVSACLIGLCTRYDGCSKPNKACQAYLKQLSLCYIPLCPEQLGGLSTPRTAADLCGGDGLAVLRGEAAVIDRNGVEVSSRFIAGAEAVLQIARSQDITLALLKSGSPSCGLTPVTGVTAALLLEHGIRVVEF
jgi:uncharacterized protein YbbK (DUF523 family)